MLSKLDEQLAPLRHADEAPDLPAEIWRTLSTTIHREISVIGDARVGQLRLAMLIPPERYQTELGAFEAWMQIAQKNRDNPVVVRAQVLTQLYVSFVWLRDSVLDPAARHAPEAEALNSVTRFMRSGTRRLLRNAIAHGRWCYLEDFSGLEYWAEPSRNQPLARHTISQDELDAYQALGRGTAIAVLLGLTDPARIGV